MNEKENILDAWITIEQLSEGSIDKKGKKLRTLYTETSEWQRLFFDFLKMQKDELKISEEKFKKSGLVLYFDIFNFQEIIDILRKEYDIQATDEETSNSDKFTFSLYFDNQLNFLADKLFFTMSGYIKHNGKLPNDFLKEETIFRNELSKKFEDEDFDAVIADLFQKFKTSQKHCRYKFVSNLENDDVSLHSFFIDDLQKAKKISTPNLSRYFDGFFGQRQNLDSKKESPNFNPQVFEDILQPRFYPLGRFPSNPDYALSFMQQVAVNLALNDRNDIRSVNGPPGTGKTTLLKDVFADLIVQQAALICQLTDKEIKGSLVYYKNGKLGFFPGPISDRGIVVASSNNGAVQNIVNELPLKEGIAEEFQEKLSEADYFAAISNLKFPQKDSEDKPETEDQQIEDKNWGAFSLEGGASTNVNNLISNIESIEKYFDEEVQSDTNVYQEFFKAYNELKSEREKVQKYSEQIKEILKLKQEHEVCKKRIESAIFKSEVSLDLDKLQQEETKIRADLSALISSIENLDSRLAQAERNFDVVKSQKPGMLWFYKIFMKSKANQYLNQLSNANEALNKLCQQKNDLFNTRDNLSKKLKEIINESELKEKQIYLEKSQFDEWFYGQKNYLKDMEGKITAFEKLKSDNAIAEIDFSISYDELQKSNPWFTKEFRILQSELFILALKVRKQFLRDNKKNLKAARIIWKRQAEYISKENGQQFLTEAWQWLNFAIPVVSTTFASFGRMFQNLNENAIGNLFIDEAGQALPQASIGGIFRSKKIMVVGDPSQIKPVLTLDSKVLKLIAQNYKVDEKFVSAEASTQTLVDETSQYGYQKDEDGWIGIPLWVHRRSNYPMFTISNEISYDGLMVQGKPEDKAYGKSAWHQSSGKAIDKFVKEQATLLSNLIDKRLEENPELKDEIYVISPFRNVAYKLAKELDEIQFTKREKGKSTNVGTVHTFQGKEAKIVYFVLGADNETKGAAKWAVSDPNMMNVAATRAKEEFYIIGDKALYSSLGSKIANKTIEIINNYNN